MEEEEENASKHQDQDMSQPGLISAETYEFMMATFEHVQPEKLLMLLNNLKTVVDGTGTLTMAGKINCLC